MSLNIIYFNLFSIIAIFFSLVLICFKNPVFSIFSLIAALMSSIMLLLISQVEFLAYIYLIVYVGAIAVLFLFVVMLLNITFEERRKAGFLYSSVDPVINIFLSIKFFSIMYTLSQYG
jgi:NADH-quinone oxidoreductase subunit J